MIEHIDMSLDDIIKNNKKSGRSDTRTSFRDGGRGRGHGRSRSRSRSRDLELGTGSGPTRRSDNRTSTRTKPYYVPQAFHAQSMLVGGESNSEAGTKLYVSNLDCEVTNEDIRVLFSDVGELKCYSIHCDRSGRSKGTAEVVYIHQSDAVAAMKRYNNVQLDGKALRLELVGVSIVTQVPVPPMQKGILGSNLISSSQGIKGRIVGRGQGRGDNSVSERGHGGGKNRPEKLSADDLDADLERYRLQAI